MPSCSHFKNDPNKKIVINYIECDPPHFHVIKDPRTKTIARIIFDQNQFTILARESPLASADGSVKKAYVDCFLEDNAEAIERWKNWKGDYSDFDGKFIETL